MSHPGAAGTPPRGPSAGHSAQRKTVGRRTRSQAVGSDSEPALIEPRHPRRVRAPRAATTSMPVPRAGDPEWYKDAVIYELRVRSFYDANGDGIGDLAGLTCKLDYLQDLGTTALWLLPFYPSPLKDDGYDISDYTAVHPDVGTVDDFRRFLEEAHQRGLRVITELVLNHSSDQHPWFQRARRASKGSVERDFYVWSDTPTLYSEARVIFRDFEDSNWTWDPIARAWYWHRFYSHQPDLNFDNPQVVKAMIEALDFWLDLGVDGVRLDAIPYLYEREGTNCENLQDTHEMLRRIRKHVDEHYADRMLLAEANQWPEDAVAYFGRGDECHMAFHFPVMPRLFMALHMEDRFPIVDVLEQTPAIPAACQWALFLRNHDELTLEMVTDEERDYMWSKYAADRRARINLGIRRRLAPLLANSRRRIELLTSLLLSLPGTPVLYYGDEIGMGDNVYLGDRNGVRTPMQWSSDRNAGFSSANPQGLILPVVTDPEYHYQTINVETQQSNPSSLLWWNKRILGLRKQRRVFGRGSMQLLHPSNHRVLAFVRKLDHDTILVVANLSRFVQYVELDLSDFRGAKPIELFGGSRLPPVRSKPYPLTLGPHAFYWIALAPTDRLRIPERSRPQLASVALPVAWDQISRDSGRRWLERLLPGFLRQQRWLGKAAAGIQRVRIDDAIAIASGDSVAHLLIVRVEPSDGLPGRYVVPLGLATGSFLDILVARFPEAVLARVVDERGATVGLIHDAMADRVFCSALLQRIEGLESDPTLRLVPERFATWESLRDQFGPRLEVHVPQLEPFNTIVGFADRVVLKLLRRVESGVEPDVEIGTALAKASEFRSTPPLVAVLRLRTPGEKEAATLAVVRGFVPNVGDAWRYTRGELARFYDSALAHGPPSDVLEWCAADTLGSTAESIPSVLTTMVGSYRTAVEWMGRRTAEFHIALASRTGDEAFRPEPFSTLQQRSIYQAIRSAALRAFEHLSAAVPEFSPRMASRAAAVLAQQRDLLAALRPLIARKIGAMSIRVHGDLRLGRMLCTGRDFLIADFAGDPEGSIAQRRMKRCALRDVATMLASFHQAAMISLLRESGGTVRAEDQQSLEPWARAWLCAVSTTFVQEYVSMTRGEGFLPDNTQDMRLLLFAYLLEAHALNLLRQTPDRPAAMTAALDALGQLLREC